ncbi:hypothetical protein TTHERM_00136390 (macronuclear) [Tetrahymena thermophila SB210]|uniref:Uncharacterized protein n=1 Tax=Tetrahymena thermophila (strain SB210) TaxID=312017 RepID=I7M8Q6_TETTS|nr:hypothetical protein TTHERM_00136390 [Tetrahymena thermophila SB210]EAR99475.2 hypothetical protein TTHERM_00136390 [Tetrahymena thermophila SB210]|eukprot:XP_001019720.2 hypothetical protein TTHERM_00136390 [Tetrahymena thermophila SB210]
MLSKILQRRFSVYSNQAQQMQEIVNGREYKYDYHIHEYDKCIQAYLMRRRIKKEEIAPKMYITEGLKGVDLSYQLLAPLKKLYDIEKMKKLHELGQINSQYIISKLQEDHFKQVMDEYVNKLPISGYVVPLEQYKEYETLQNKIVGLYRQFFFGDENQTPFERDTEMRYLVEKREKYSKYIIKNAIRYKCNWTLSNQRRQELMKNWRGRNINIYDDLRPIYEKLDLESKESINQLTQKIVGQQKSVLGIFRQILYYLIERGIYSRTSRRRYEMACTMLLIRTVIYTNSIEFTSVMNIPADFHIEHAILNMHIWLMVDRLNEINTPISRFMAKQLLVSLKKNQLQSISRIHLKKKNDFIKDVIHYMQANRNAFHNHFRVNPITSKGDDAYQKLDALVWSTIFFEKVPRYSPEVYMMADYFKQNFDYLKTCTFQDFEDGMIEFDCYRIDPDFVNKVQKYSPRLNEQEFLEEFYSEKTNKRYYYSYQGVSENAQRLQDTNSQQNENQSEKIEDLPINTEEGLNSTRYKDIKGIDETLNKTLYKYQTLHTFDHMNELEKQTKESQKKAKKYAFSQTAEEKATNEVDELDPEYIKKIRYQRNKQQSESEQKQK